MVGGLSEIDIYYDIQARQNRKFNILIPTPIITYQLDLYEEITNAMTADDFLKFCDNIEYEKTSVADEEVFVDLDFIEEELRKSIYLIMEML